jgi:hypothetical protein
MWANYWLDDLLSPAVMNRAHKIKSVDDGESAKSESGKSGIGFSGRFEPQALILGGYTCNRAPRFLIARTQQSQRYESPDALTIGPKRWLV